MCGIVGYVGRQQALSILLDGLSQLEYRGYDSAGVGILDGGHLDIKRTVGRVKDLRKVTASGVSGTIGVGHTRWATHGPATEANAHPHCSADGRIAVVHNGIIDNALALRSHLSSHGVTFHSDTDTEVIAHLIAHACASSSSFEAAVMEAISQIEGTFGVAVLDAAHPDRIVIARHGSPLIIGVGENAMYVASDIAAIVRHTDKVVHLDDGEFAVIDGEGFRTFMGDGSKVTKTPVRAGGSVGDYDKGGYEHFMRKEYLEQPTAAASVLRGRVNHRLGSARLDGLNLDARQLRAFKRVKILGCGSAYYAGQVGAHMIEELARVPADAEAASEFRYRNPVIDPSTLYIAVSQSGETVDTFFAVEEIKSKGGYVVGLVNVVGSSIARACNGGVYLHAGAEVAVASTKVLTNMGVAFALLAVTIGRVRDLSLTEGQRLLAGLEAISENIDAILAREGVIAEIATELAQYSSLFFIGRVRGYPVAREGAQKFKEISYRHAEAYQSSELKHGPLALITANLPTVAIVPDDELLNRNIGALQEVAARKGPLVAITHPNVDFGDLDVRRVDVPKNETELDPILLTIPTQILAYHAALALGHDIDKPRNLAKAVTVE